MREILTECIRLDGIAATTYESMHEACADTHLALTFHRMGLEERAHVEWWSSLLEAWDEGLVPDLDNEGELRERLGEIAQYVDSTLPEDLRTLSTDQMLELAVHLEFYLLDPIFGELLDLMEPGSSQAHRQAYSLHVMRLVSEIEERYSERTLARFLARVLARSYRDQQRLAALATHDPLTGLYNRRGFYGYLRQWTAWAGRYGHPIGVLIVDVDHFKNINDTHGHPGGDVALHAIASALNNAVRGSDLVGRYGGDEFAILAPETDEAELAGLAQRVLDLVRSNPIRVGGTDIEVTVSIGGAFSRGDATATPEQILAAADRSMYHAKAAGRDRAGDLIDASQT